MGVSKKELMDRFNWPETTARRYLDDLVRLEYLVKIKDFRKRQYVYKLLFNSEDDDNDALMLLDPDTLE